MNRALELIVARLKSGHMAAYLTDAGTPGISDPAWRLVLACVTNNLNVMSLPGPSAVTMIVSLADAPLDEWRFMGFLPKKKGFQTTVSELIDYLGAGKNRGVIFYESPNRVGNTLSVIASQARQSSLTPHGGEGQNEELQLHAVIGRELTKKFETVYRGDLTPEFIAAFPEKGEYTILLTQL